MANQGSAGRIVLVGAGGHAAVVAEAGLLAGLEIVGFFDDNPEATLRAVAPGVRHLGEIADAGARAPAPLIVALGDLAVRRRVIRALAETAAPIAGAVVHPRAFVSPSAALMAGVFVGPGAVVHSRAVVGPHAILNSACVVEHDCRVGENAHIAPGAVLGGEVIVGDDSLIGLGARVLPGRRVGPRATIGAGAVVIRDVGVGETAVGVPAVGR